MLKNFVRTGVAAAAIFGIGLVGANLMTMQKKPKNKVSGKPKIRRPEQKVRVTIIDKDSGEFLIANVHIVGEDHDGEGRYRFHTPQGRFFDLDLSEGAWQIIRRKTYA